MLSLFVWCGWVAMLLQENKIIGCEDDDITPQFSEISTGSQERNCIRLVSFVLEERRHAF